MKIKALILAALLLAPAAAFAQKTELRRIDDAIRNEEAALQKLVREKKSAAAQIASIAAQTENYKKLIKTLDSEMNSNRERIKDIRSGIEDIKKNILKTKTDISKSNIFFIDNMGFSQMKVIATAQNPSVTVKTLEIISKASAKLEANVKRLSAKAFEMESLIAEERARLKEAEILNGRRKEALVKLEKENKRYKNALTMLKHDEAGRREYVEMLEFQRKELDDELKRASNLVIRRNLGLENRLDSPKSNIPRGSMVWPVEGAVVEKFGETFMEDAGVVFFHKGIKIRPEKPGPVFAAAGGEVIFADHMKGFDNIVVLDHGEAFYTVYGNLSELKAKAGDKISRGDILGRINVDLDNNTSYLYFEIRKNEKALDPADWLAGYRRR